MNESPGPSWSARTGWIVAFVVVAVLAALGAILVHTKMFGAFSIVREPYYPAVSREIVSDPTFQRDLGQPLEIDNGGVWCNYIEDSPTMHQANCDIPVRGTRASGTVHAQIVDTGSLDISLWLHIGGRIYPGNR